MAILQDKANPIKSGSSVPDIFPDSRTRQPTRVILGGSGPYRMNWVPIYCANCGKDRGLVPEENCNFAFALCDPCAERLGPISNTYMEPDTIFWEKVKQFQLEKYGRELSGPEIAEALKDEHHPLTKLARDRKTTRR